MEDAGGHDTFYFPLNVVVAVNPFTGAARRRVAHDPRYFTGAVIRAALGQYLAILENWVTQTRDMLSGPNMPV